MKFIISENKMKIGLKSLVKNHGWESTSDMVGGYTELATLAFNNDPFEFLNMFNDLTIVSSEKYDAVYFKNELNDDFLMKYYNLSNSLYVDTVKIWKFLEKGFNMDDMDIQIPFREWFEKVYKMKVRIVTDVNVYWMG